MPPLWKIYRELDRLRQMLAAAVGRLYEPILQRAHDRRRDERIEVIDGALPRGGKIAVFLVYQPRGLSPTVLETAAHIASKGYAPLVVSNTPLSGPDRTALAETAWKILLRPNYGYDFGGYRDAILWLSDRQIAPDRLMILNDSIWFPVWPEETLIDRMEALGADLAGAVIHPSQRRRKIATRRPAFIESYFYIANRRAIESPAFRAFWQGFRVSSIKFNAVYRGERSFSHFLEKSGLSVQGVIHADPILAAIGTRDDAFLARTLDYGAYTDPDFEAERDVLLATATGGPGWRRAALDHIERVLRRRSAYASFPYAAFHLLGVPFVKKSRLKFFGQAFGTVQIKMRTQILRAVQAGDLPRPRERVLDEMRAIEEPPDHARPATVAAGAGKDSPGR